eukprot:gene9323-10124_t
MFSKTLVRTFSKRSLARSSIARTGLGASFSLAPSRNILQHNTPSFLTTGRRFNSTSTDAPTTSNSEKMSFQAETRKLLDIVTHSIYTDKEVFLRELVSNASDALEKFRYFQVSGAVKGDGTHPLEINIITDSEKNTLTIIDNGIGMTREELVANLGTIARSGSKQFVEQLSKGEGSTGASKDGIIGQFGVGFYSSFMVSDEVSVESLSGQKDAGEATYNRWKSDGSGEFLVENVSEIEGLTSPHGSKIVMKLKESCKEFSDAERIKSIIRHYSSFVSFPIKVNGDVVNTVGAIWLKDKKEVTDEQYKEFYKFISNAFDEPKYTLHFRTDAPIDLKCILFVPSFHSEKFGMGVMEPGVNLYSRKVLIESKPKDLLPDWLRFLKGVVDSEDLPLSLSREKPQDSRLLTRIKDALTRKLLKFLEDEMKNNPTKFREFYNEYHMFLKQGVCQDYKFMDSLSKLLMFESSSGSSDHLVTFDEYISRCPPEQKDIYYLVAPNREAALSSPYYETFKKHKREVLLLYSTIDDFVMSNLKTFAGRNLVSAETSSIKFDDAPSGEAGDVTLTEDQGKDLCGWLQMTLGEKLVREVRVTHRLSDSPAIVTDHESGAMRRMLRMVEQANSRSATVSLLPPQVLEINPKHPIIAHLFQLKDNPNHNATSSLVAQQLYDNALMSAGLLEDPRAMIPRLNQILLHSLKSSSHNTASEEKKE